MDAVMLTYNFLEYSDNYSNILGSLWQYYRDEPALNNVENIIDVPANNNNSVLLKFKEKITGKTDEDRTKMMK